LTDFETQMNVIFAAMTWTNVGATPTIHLGKIRNQQADPKTAYNIKAGEGGAEVNLSGSGGVAFYRYRGTIEGWSDTATKRDKILADCIAEFPGQGVNIRSYEENYYQNYRSFIMEVDFIA